MDDVAVGREQLAAYLRSIGLDGWAESAEHLVGAERVIKGLAEVTPETAQAGLDAHCERMNVTKPPFTAGLSETYATIYTAMLAARFPLA